MKNLQELGVGIVYFQPLENFIESHSALINAIEIEPQTLWYGQNAECDLFNIDAEASKRINDLPQPKIFHCVGFPIGGSILPDEHYFQTLNEHIEILKPIWISEHLSFNKFYEDEKCVDVNFLLPPLQTPEGIETAVKAIRHFQKYIDLPFIFETGTNYLKPKKYEIADGKFVAQIAESANCGILLDLHNILANERNGRQKVRDFISQIPLERVFEIHVAGGFVHNEYYLDAHSGISDAELFEILQSVVAETPNLKAINFEMLPQYVEYVSETDLREQFEKMNRIWERKGQDSRKPAGKKVSAQSNKKVDFSVKDWEYALGRSANNNQFTGNGLAKEFSNDKGVEVIKELIFHFRASAIVSSLKMTTRLLKLSLGEEKFNAELSDFFAKSDSHLFPYAAAKKYAEYLIEKNYKIKYLYGVLDFEMAALTTAIDDTARKVEFDFNPLPVFRELIDFKMPGEQDTEMNFIIEIKPDELTDKSDLLKFKSLYNN
jgi:uncharacterized protein (UPF0276 family)